MKSLLTPRPPGTWCPPNTLCIFWRHFMHKEVNAYCGVFPILQIVANHTYWLTLLFSFIMS